MSVPNQKKAQVHKEPCDKKNIYVCMNINALQYACKRFKPTELKVWIYFAKNQNNYEFELSSAAVQEACNISDKSYREAIKTLIAERHLIQRGSSNYYDFYELPKEVDEMPRDGAKITCHTSTIITEE